MPLPDDSVTVATNVPRYPAAFATKATVCVSVVLESENASDPEAVSLAIEPVSAARSATVPVLPPAANTTGALMPKRSPASSTGAPMSCSLKSALPSPVVSAYRYSTPVSRSYQAAWARLASVRPDAASIPAPETAPRQIKRVRPPPVSSPLNTLRSILSVPWVKSVATSQPPDQVAPPL